MSDSGALVWIRRDVRLSDHVALAKACANHSRVALLFVFDRLILDELQDRDDRRVSFIYQALSNLDQDLRRRGSRLIVAHGDPVVEVPRVAATLRVTEVYANGDVDPYAVRRDSAIKEKLNLHLSKDHVVFAKREVLNGSGEPFRVFTPYAKAWRAKLRPEVDLREHVPELSRLWPLNQLPQSAPELKPLCEYGFTPNHRHPEASEAGARRQLEAFLPKLNEYKTKRDFYAENGTSRMSVHLRHGTISVRECFRAALERSGSEKWISELIWREFYQMILACWPEVVSENFNPNTARIEWPGSREQFAAWEEGRTGFPVVDAAMRCLRSTGEMPNRLRMVAAMFCTKDLLCDWRWGEAVFARYLLDYDLASNNGGWQWSASTGADAQPYFRVMNPVLQSAKFDPEAKFIAQWCPELAGFEAERRHWPHDASAMEQELAGCRLGVDYPHPVVDHRVQRERAIALFNTENSS